MTYDEIDRMMRRMLPEAPTTWMDPANDNAKAYFCFCMRHRQYGYEALRSAWESFYEGYVARGADDIRDTYVCYVCYPAPSHTGPACKHYVTMVTNAIRRK